MKRIVNSKTIIVSLAEPDVSAGDVSDCLKYLFRNTVGEGVVYDKRADVGR